MGTSTFQFKQFTIHQDRCAMKVGTDAVLLGAWVRTAPATRVLDVGTGTGVLALMLAQRSTATIDALELDADAALQARENVLNSPWNNRVRIITADARTWSNEHPYELMVSNPPFFRQSLKAPTLHRSQARHDDTLNWEQLVHLADRQLASDGRFALILPVESEGVFEALCWQRGLYLQRHCAVSTREGAPPKRLLMEFSRNQGLVEYSFLALQAATHKRTEAFSTLTADFYLC